jgi:membrane-associated protein
MLELFKHLIHLDKESFQWIVANYGTSIYTVLFLIIFVETGLVVMPILPGDSLLFTAGLFARMGSLDIGYLILLLFVAAILGDNVNYILGRNVGLRVLHIKIKGKSIVKQQYINKTHLFFEKYGTKTIIMARFVPIVRTFSPFVAGIAEMKYSRFILFDLFGGALWICSLTLTGYFLGNIEWIQNHIDAVVIGIIVLSVMPIVIGILKRKGNKK